MSTAYTDEHVTVHHGDCLDVMDAAAEQGDGQ